MDCINYHNTENIEKISDSVVYFWLSQIYSYPAVYLINCHQLT